LQERERKLKKKICQDWWQHWGFFTNMLACLLLKMGFFWSQALSNGCPQFATDEKPVSASCHALLLPYEEGLLEYLVISKDFAWVIFLNINKSSKTEMQNTMGSQQSGFQSGDTLKTWEMESSGL
jgi:hypothetical protein